MPTFLDGLHVVSLATNVPGPVAAARLRAMGARVTKVEPPNGDYLAIIARSWHDALVEDQEIVRLDLKSDAGCAALDTLLTRADVLLTSHRPAALERLGLATATLRARFPALCIVSIVGREGPRADRPGHDLTYQATAGLVSPPAMPASLFADLATGEAAVTAALALVVQRARTGQGGASEVGLSDVAARLAAPRLHGLTMGDGVLGGALPMYGLYAVRDGWIAVAALELHFAERLATALGLVAPSHDDLARAFAERSAGEWEAWALEHDLPIEIVRSATGAALGA